MTDAPDSAQDLLPEDRRTPWLAWVATGLAAAGAVAALFVWLWRRRRTAAQVRRRRALLQPVHIPVEGLTEAEAEARRQEGQDNVIQLKPPRTRQQAVRDNILNIFNLNLVGLAFAQILIGQPLDALLSLGTLLLNTGLNVAQEMLARRRLADIEQATRPKATVVRDGQVRSIDPSEIVLGDALIVGPGDQILVDGTVIGEGQIAVDESLLSGDSTRRTKKPGEQVYAGSFCLSGRAACRVQRVGQERRIMTRLADAPAGDESLTPLERVIRSILWVLLAFVVLFSVIFLANYLRLDTGQIPTDVANEVASLIFNIAPASLFLMIVVTYASGTADLGRLGALVYRARSVESLAESNVICFAKAGILTGTQVDIELAADPEGQPPLAESRIRQILGDFARTSALDNQATRLIQDAFEGSPRAPVDEAPFLSAFGWSAIAFDDEDLRGVYVLAEPEVLAAHQAEAIQRRADQERGSPLAAVRRTVAPLGRLFGRGRNGDEDTEGEAAQVAQPDTATSADASASPPPLAREDQAAEQGAASPPAEGKSLAEEHEGEASAPLAGEEAEKGSPPPQEARGVRRLLGGLTRRVKGVFRRDGDQEEEAEADEDLAAPETMLAFAYAPDLVPLYNAEGQPQLPDELIPLCTLTYAERVRPEAIETLQNFAETGVDIKVFTPGEPERTATMLRNAGWGQGSANALRTITGPEIAGLQDGPLARAVTEHTIFGRITPQQAGQVVAALRGTGKAIAVVGDSTGDLPPLRQANLAVARQSSTQAALSVADIVLLQDSPAVLSTVLGKGQRIVNGLLDVLKLNLSQVFTLAFLLVSIRLLAAGYPYRSGQGTVVTIVTVALPSIGLSLGASAGVLPTANLGRLLARIVVPASLTMGATAFLVYAYFLETTGSIAYAQLTLMYTLVGCGLLLVVFVKPPRPAWWSGSPQSGAWWPLILAVVLAAAVVLVARIPLAQQLLQLDVLRQPADYGTVGLAVLLWAVSLRLILGLIPLERRFQSAARRRLAKA